MNHDEIDTILADALSHGGDHWETCPSAVAHELFVNSGRRPWKVNGSFLRTAEGRCIGELTLTEKPRFEKLVFAWCSHQRCDVLVGTQLLLMIEDIMFRDGSADFFFPPAVMEKAQLAERAAQLPLHRSMKLVRDMLGYRSTYLVTCLLHGYRPMLQRWDKDVQVLAAAFTDPLSELDGDVTLEDIKEGWRALLALQELRMEHPRTAD